MEYAILATLDSYAVITDIIHQVVTRPIEYYIPISVLENKDRIKEYSIENCLELARMLSMEYQHDTSDNPNEYSNLKDFEPSCDIKNPNTISIKKPPLPTQIKRLAIKRKITGKILDSSMINPKTDNIPKGSKFQNAIARPNQIFACQATSVFDPDMELIFKEARKVYSKPTTPLQLAISYRKDIDDGCQELRNIKNAEFSEKIKLQLLNEQQAKEHEKALKIREARVRFEKVSKVHKRISTKSLPKPESEIDLSQNISNLRFKVHKNQDEINNTK